MTTDTVPKTAWTEFQAGGKTCRLGGICKGSGMIHPNMGHHAVRPHHGLRRQPGGAPGGAQKEDGGLLQPGLRGRGYVHQRHLLRPGQRPGGKSGDHGGGRCGLRSVRGGPGGDLRDPGEEDCGGRGGSRTAHHLHRIRGQGRGDGGDSGQGGLLLLPGEGCHVRSRRQLGKDPLCHGIFRGRI